ncbi:GNAT family N-acetyltransferase [Paenibacillus albiflavus]|uniref:GNAT family N-acetyltransferase n=1 Tax=Paenibacillus albiflavus TaxID=2545760 RepID=A0A4R4EIA6_9BACL|nr:GNAT family N-acetyltransferase [Paenibacillus albiflavus]TCZ79874.1 GNAT family N-acetyltransferase [Paenibacillus albiflavus]
MGEIRRITEQEIPSFVSLMGAAYPANGLHNEQARNNVITRTSIQYHEDQETGFYGYFRDEEMLGGMKFFDFHLNVYEAKVFAGGIGSVCVDLLHKKERIAKEMLTYFLRHYRQAGASMALLHPFRVSFYKQMGFAIGPKMHQYRVSPANLPKGPKDKLIYLNKDDKQAMVDCYNRYAASVHGMIEKHEFECRRWFDDPSNVYVGYKQDNQILGYLIFNFKRASESNFLLNDLIVKELIFETPDALSQLLAFLHSQADQIRQIVINTQDEDFHYLLSETGNDSTDLLPHVAHISNVSGVGLMYRIIDVHRLFSQLSSHSFGQQTCKLKLMIHDSLLTENECSIVVHFADGYPTISSSSDYEVELQIDISEFTALMMGTVSFLSLYNYKLVKLSDESYLSQLNKLFHADTKPRCITPF